ncbi:hypothetical protein PGT21_000583 [Puccinia graminis f. sp. tritici]|uniref:Uncharacterized protein n=1 Tax=Puccinia graminis f. sp. tritici TaxID=56615 RepID=A0A5B0P4V0_PUCGR|nr:hypothetical protein PGT21_000366 [Puccinia graminis f. sp. tritici]KAA1095540.1 hypothetical protein PGT21_000583 [Puccinia graminis f. sp. tritici]
MVFSQAQDGPTLPTTNPASTGIFSGNQNNPNINIDPPIIPPLLPPPPMRTSHTRVRHYCERYGAHQNNQQNDNPAGSGNTQQTNYPAGTYGLPPDIQEMDEPMPRPAVIIKEPDLRYEGDSGQHITVPIAKIGQGKGWNQMKNLNQVGTAYTKAYQTQDTVQSHFLDGSDFTIKPSLVQRKLKWVKKICHLVKNKTSKEKSDQPTLKQQHLEIQLPVECKTPQLLFQTKPKSDYVGPTINYTEPMTDYTETMKDYTEPMTDYTEPMTDYTEPIMETAATTIKLPDLVEEWKAASAKVMDTPLELAHTGIEIPGMVLDRLDAENYVDHEEILDQSVQQVKELDQSIQLNKNYMKFLLTENLAEDLEFPKASELLWIRTLNTHQHKLFNKQLFKPYLDAYRLFENLNKIAQHLGHNTTEPEENEETFVLPPALGLSDNSTTIKNLLEKVIQLNSLVELEDSIISLSHFRAPKILLFRFQLLKELSLELLLKIPPDRFGQPYTDFHIPRILVGVG